jgi:putative phosphoribosyl transferase
VAIFADRAHAGEQLATELAQWRGTDAVILGIPRGGVVVAAAVARALGLPLDVAVVRKLGAPTNEEFAVGAIADGVRVINPSAVRSGGVTPEQLAFVEDLERVELQRRERAYAVASVPLRGRPAIVVDDGVATGATMTAACLAAKARGASAVIAAIPVAPHDWRPERSIDAVVCPHRETDFWAVGQFYDDFDQTTDGEVLRLLSQNLPGSGGG